MGKYHNELQCGHIVDTVERDRSLYPQERCKFCGWQDVIKVWYAQWHVTCRTCGWRAAKGKSKKYANQSADMHRNYNPGHRVVVQWYDDLPKDRAPIVPDRKKLVQETLIDPPF